MEYNEQGEKEVEKEEEEEEEEEEEGKKKREREILRQRNHRQSCLCFFCLTIRNEDPVQTSRKKENTKSGSKHPNQTSGQTKSEPKHPPPNGVGFLILVT